MAEYIERSAAIEAAKHAWAKGLEPSQYIEALPAADVAPAERQRLTSIRSCMGNTAPTAGPRWTEVLTMRTIDADKLVDMLYDNEFAVLCPLNEVSGVVDACPIVDAVVVMRCKDCAHYEMGTCLMLCGMANS